MLQSCLQQATSDRQRRMIEPAAVLPCLAVTASDKETTAHDTVTAVPGTCSDSRLSLQSLLAAAASRPGPGKKLHGKLTQQAPVEKQQERAALSVALQGTCGATLAI
jgi:hypothetical protein